MFQDLFLKKWEYIDKKVVIIPDLKENVEYLVLYFSKYEHSSTAGR